MRQKLLLIVVGAIIALFLPAYAPLGKSIALRGFAWFQPGSLEYCSGLGKHIASRIEEPAEWDAASDGTLNHRVSKLSTDGHKTTVGTIDVTERLTSYDRDVIQRRVAALRQRFRELDDERLVKTLDLQQQLKIDGTLAAGLTGKN